MEHTILGFTRSYELLVTIAHLFDFKVSCKRSRCCKETIWFISNSGVTQGRETHRRMGWRWAQVSRRLCEVVDWRSPFLHQKLSCSISYDNKKRTNSKHFNHLVYLHTHSGLSREAAPRKWHKDLQDKHVRKDQAHATDRQGNDVGLVAS